MIRLLTDAERAALAKKSELLKQGGFKYQIGREIYVNREKKKVISREYVEDHSPEELELRIRQPGRANGWNYIFNFEPPDSTKRELESSLD